jgi:hypothetical protein
MYICSIPLTLSISDFSKNKLLQKFLLNPQNKQCPKIFTFQYFTPLNLIWRSVSIRQILLGRERTLRVFIFFVGCNTREIFSHRESKGSNAIILVVLKSHPNYHSQAQCVNPLTEVWKGLGVRGV